MNKEIETVRKKYASYNKQPNFLLDLEMLTMIIKKELAQDERYIERCDIL